MLADAVPATGMGNGGPVFIVLLLLPISAAGIGAMKRFGRGLSAMALVGALGAWLLAMVKLSDISSGGEVLSQLGAKVTMSAAGGYYVFLFATTVVTLASIVGLIKPEPKVASGSAPATQAVGAS